MAVVRRVSLLGAGGLVVAAAVVAAAVHAAASSVGELAGRRLVVAMEGTSPSTSLVRRIRAGEVGGVFISTPNIESAPQLRALTRTLRKVATESKRPPILVFVDQEGGYVRRVGWVPPALSAAALAERSIGFAETTGRLTGVALSRLGIDVDLAPVADVPAADTAFIARQRRAYGSTPARVAVRAAAFARGLASAGVLATAKHFPGLGLAQRSTDDQLVVIDAPWAELRRHLLPFRVLVRSDVALVMLSNAMYSALDETPAVWSRRVDSLLRDGLGFDGDTITDAIEPLARAHGVTSEEAAVRAAEAGVDLILVTGLEPASERVHAALAAALESGRLDRRSFRMSIDRIDALSRARRG
ncbi:MAG: beta-N-acetylhexosaminidase [Actinobacteria bacterium]|nr:beta-N-acetylhexosaminidase [Actinomycetota bacterium]